MDFRAKFEKRSTFFSKHTKKTSTATGRVGTKRIIVAMRLRKSETFAISYEILSGMGGYIRKKPYDFS